MEKARERNDEGHQQVVQILESPSNYITLNSHVNNVELSGDSILNENKAKKFEDENVNSVLKEVDLVLAKQILQKLVPIFCDIFQVCF